MQTLAGEANYEETIRHSRFIAHAAPVRSEPEALGFLGRVSDTQATHNCWAWRIDQAYRFNDDGEPSGSAGRPILASIEGRELDRVMIVVTRHFGGIKLGVGGLVRAYGGTAAKCLDRAELVEIIPVARCVIEADFAHAGVLHPLLDRYDASKETERFVEGGIRLEIRLPERNLEEFEQALADASRGQARLRRSRV